MKAAIEEAAKRAAAERAAEEATKKATQGWASAKDEPKKEDKKFCRFRTCIDPFDCNHLDRPDEEPALHGCARDDTEPKDLDVSAKEVLEEIANDWPETTGGLPGATSVPGPHPPLSRQWLARS